MFTRHARLGPRLGLFAVALLAACAPSPDLPPLTAITPTPAALVAAAPTRTPSRPPTPAPTPEGAPVSLLALGASDVVGLGATDPDTEGWAPVLAALIEKRTGRPIALSRHGVIARLASEMRAVDLPAAVAEKPAIAVVWTGANDMMRGVELAAFRADLDAIAQGLGATGAAVYLINLPALDRLPFFAKVKDGYRVAVPLWQAAIADVAKKRGATPVDLSAYSDELDAHPDYLWIDGFHPNTRGYARLAAIVDAAIGDKPPLSR